MILANVNSRVMNVSLAELRREGFDESEISVLYTDAGHTIQAGMIAGALWGGVPGALVGLLFPPAGLLVAAGPILGVFLSGVGLAATGAVTVAALDGLIAALIHLGMPREIATSLGERVRKADALVMVHADSPERAELARAILAAHHPRIAGYQESKGVVSVSPGLDTPPVCVCEKTCRQRRSSPTGLLNQWDQLCLARPPLLSSSHSVELYLCERLWIYSLTASVCSCSAY